MDSLQTILFKYPRILHTLFILVYINQIPSLRMLQLPYLHSHRRLASTTILIDPYQALLVLDKSFIIS